MNKFEKEWEFEFNWGELVGTLAYGWMFLVLISCLLLSAGGAAIAQEPNDSGVWVILAVAGLGFILLPVLYAIPWVRKLPWTKAEKLAYKEYARRMDQTEGDRRRRIEG